MYHGLVHTPVKNVVKSIQDGVYNSKRTVNYFGKKYSLVPQILFKTMHIMRV